MDRDVALAGDRGKIAVLESRFGPQPVGARAHLCIYSRAMRFNPIRTDQVVAAAGRTLSITGTWLMSQFDVAATPTAPIETAAFLDSFLPSLMPRTSSHQGMAAGVGILGARLAGGTLETVGGLAVRPSAPLSRHLVLRAAEGLAGHGLATLPERDDEGLGRSVARSAGYAVRSAAIGGAVFDISNTLRARSSSQRQTRILGGVMVTSGLVIWASKRLAVRKEEIQRWPIVQNASTLEAAAFAAAMSWTGTGLARAFQATGRGARRYFGPGPTKSVLALAVNTAAWTGGLVGAYNGVIAAIGRANEKIEPAYATIPNSELVSGSAESGSPFAELGQQGRRFVTDVVTPDQIEEVMGEPAAAHPIRTYVGFNSEPVYPTGRAELALAELERTGAFDRSYLLLVSPTGTGWVDQTVVEAAELLTRGDLATCSIQYGRFPSFLCVQKVGLGRIQFRLLLWGIRLRLAAQPPENRPKVLIFGESLGAWTASDVLLNQGIKGFDHYGIDRALWVGLPALARWSRNGMTRKPSDLVPAGTVGVFDNHEQLAALDDTARAGLRAVVLSHDNDPVAALKPELAVQQPEWLRETRGRNVSRAMDWIPFVTFWQVAIDAANAMVMVPGEFRSFGHDYRADISRFVRDAFQLPDADEPQMERIDSALKRLDVERVERINETSDDGEQPVLSVNAPLGSFRGGVPIVIRHPTRARWFGRRTGAVERDVGTV
ncbi:MAG: alpha/beta-hydrolase family protein [Acidimicrobiales bacterium]